MTTRRSVVRVPGPTATAAKFELVSIPDGMSKQMIKVAARTRCHTCRENSALESQFRPARREVNFWRSRMRSAMPASLSLVPERVHRAMPPKAASSPRKGTMTRVTTDPTPLALPALLKLLCSSGPKPPHLTMSQAISAASKLVPKGYTSPAKLRTLTQVEMSALGIADDEIRRGLMAVIGKAGGKGTGDSPEVRRKRTRESDLDRPLPMRAPRETAVDEDFEFDEIEAEEVSDASLPFLTSKGKARIRRC